MRDQADNQIEARNATRLCPACGRAEPIEPAEQLWPATWCCRGCGASLPRREGHGQLAPSLDDTDVGMDRESFAVLEAVEQDHFWFVTRNELITWLVGRFSPRAQRVMEIGCGTGFVLGALKRALPEARISGSELHSRGLAFAARRHGSEVELLQMDARQSYLRNAFDLVGAFDVLEHIPDDEGTLSEIARTLAPGGRLIATVPQHPWMWSPADDLACHQRRYRRGELMAKAEAAGLKPIYSSSFVCLAFPAMVTARLLSRRRSEATLDSFRESEFEIGSGSNRLLMGLTRFEHSLRKHGMPMPFGGSQVIVVERSR